MRMPTARLHGQTRAQIGQNPLPLEPPCAFFVKGNATRHEHPEYPIFHGQQRIGLSVQKIVD